MKLRWTLHFVDDLGADSLDIFQIIIGIDDAFDIEIENDEDEKDFSNSR